MFMKSNIYILIALLVVACEHKTDMNTQEDNKDSQLADPAKLAGQVQLSVPEVSDTVRIAGQPQLSAAEVQEFLQHFLPLDLPVSVNREFIRQSDSLPRIDSATVLRFLRPDLVTKNAIEWHTDAGEPRYGWRLPPRTDFFAVIHSERYPVAGYNVTLFLTTFSTDGKRISTFTLAEYIESIASITESQTNIDTSYVLRSRTDVTTFDAYFIDKAGAIQQVEE